MTRHPKLGAAERWTALSVNVFAPRELRNLRRSGALQGALGLRGEAANCASLRDCFDSSNGVRHVDYKLVLENTPRTMMGCAHG